MKYIRPFNYYEFRSKSDESKKYIISFYEVPGPSCPLPVGSENRTGAIFTEVTTFYELIKIKHSAFKIAFSVRDILKKEAVRCAKIEFIELRKDIFISCFFAWKLSC